MSAVLGAELIQRAAGITAREAIPRVLPITSPAAGADFAFTVPGGVVWLVESLTATLTTSAAVANRLVGFTLADGTTTFGRYASTSAQTANVTGRYGFWRNLGQAFTVGGSASFTAPFPSSPLLGGWTVQFVTTLIDALDQWSAIALYVIEIEERPYLGEEAYELAVLEGRQTRTVPNLGVGY